MAKLKPAVSDPNSYYAKRQKIYPREVKGRFQRLRNLSVLILLGLYYFLPWLNWDFHQAVLFDLPDRKFYIFGLIFWPQDFFYLAGLLIVAALSLFFFTTVAGRLWCGYACPQTVWTEVFIWMERWVEGNRSRQMKLDEAPFGSRKIWIKAKKHGLWIAFALWTGFTFVGYFTPIRELSIRTMTINLGSWETFWILFYAFATYGNAGWLREQVCIYMCPYARFQSAMFDKNTLIVSYDRARGEPRGSLAQKAKQSQSAAGDCIDCTLCVQVCPTGIDIREGLQYQCIGCAACIDVCDDVMAKVGFEPGLVRYTSESALKEGGTTRFFRLRTFAYLGLLLGIVTAIVVGISGRALLEFDVIRDRNALYRSIDANRVENVYTLRVLNKDDVDHPLELSATGLEGLELMVDSEELIIGAGRVLDVPIRIRVSVDSIPGVSNDIEIYLKSALRHEIVMQKTARFLGPS